MEKKVILSIIISSTFLVLDAQQNQMQMLNFNNGNLFQQRNNNPVVLASNTSNRNYNANVKAKSAVANSTSNMRSTVASNKSATSHSSKPSIVKANHKPKNVSNSTRQTVNTNKVIQRKQINPPTLNLQVQAINPINDLVIQIDNVGNEFNLDVNQVQLQASAEIPQLNISNGEMNFELSLPKVNLAKAGGRSVHSKSNTTKHKIALLDRKIKKLNRKLSAKLSIKKKLKLKVDNCFKW